MTRASSSTTRGPLSGLTVVDMSTTLPGAQATMFLADAGADVLLVEPPVGSRLREQSGWPALGRGKSSVVLDLHDNTDHEALLGLIAEADVLVTTMTPAASERLGLTTDALATLNPRLVSAAITGWGPDGPFRDIPGYEALVMAKLGIFFGKRQTSTRPGPSFVPTAFASWGAAHTAVHGILTALYEREQSGTGQHVDADLVRGIATMDTWQWQSELIVDRWPDAFTPVTAFTDDGTPHGALIYPLLVTPTADGYWMQFAQTEPRLFLALMTELGLDWMFTDPRWEGIPRLTDPALRIELWEMMLERASSRTLPQWQEVFETNPHISAEVFTHPAEALQHPQFLHEGRTIQVDDPQHGPVVQPGPLVYENNCALRSPQPAPPIGQRHDARPPAVRPDTSGAHAAADAPSGLPLDGVTVLELGSMFAGPYGATLLTDLGARVIKVEPEGGDTIRGLVPFPEAGGAKVMQGKESISLNIRTPEGLAIVHEWAAKADIVLQTYRAGTASRMGIDMQTLRAINPALVYLNAPGYGTDGPYGTKPAYAPSIGAAVGLALNDVPDATERVGTLDEVKATAIRLYAGGANLSVQADGISALAVASTMLLGLLARRRGHDVGELTTTMLASCTHALIDRNVVAEGGAAPPQPDASLFGYSALYRLYEASDGWVFLAAPRDEEWSALAAAMLPHKDLLQDNRFRDAAARRDSDAVLTETLTDTFITRPASDWEDELLAQGVGCVAAAECVAERTLQSDEFANAGYAVTAVHPIFDEYRRLSPVTRFSRSTTRALGGCLAGQHTDDLLTELGRTPDEIDLLRKNGIVFG